MVQNFLKKWWRWLALALVVLCLLVGYRAWKKHQGANPANPSATQSTGAAPSKGVSTNAAATTTEIELAAQDWMTAQSQTVVQSVALSGALKAVNMALVKARVAGELQNLIVREGDFVKAGQPLAKIDPTEYVARVRQAKEQADSAKAQANIAQRQFDNSKALVDQGFISKTALERDSSSLAGALATHKAALAQVDVAQKALDDTVLTSPISGQVSQRLAQPGERVGIDARVLEVIDISRLEMEATLSPADAAQVRLGQKAELQIEGVTKPLIARVSRINPALQAGSRAVLVYLALDSSAGLRQGLFAQGNLGLSQLRGVAVPESAVRNDLPQPYVQLVIAGKVKHWPAVVLGSGDAQAGASNKVQAAERVAVLQDLPEGTIVIAGNVGQLPQGTALKLAK